MGGINRVIEIGRLVRDCELKYSNTGTAICNFSIAVSEYIGKDREDYSNYFDCVIYGKRAESLNPYLKKGQQVGIDGRLHQNRWTNQEGENRSKIQIKVSDLELLGKKPQGSNEQQTNSKPFDPVKAFHGNQQKPEEFEDEIPF